MVSKKRLDYGFSGHRALVVPRAPRSIRRRRSYKSPIEDSKLCAFELLAAVADKLLQESESSASSNIAEGKENPTVHLDGSEKQKLIDDKPSKSNRGSCDESSFVLESSIPDSNLLPQAETGSVLEQTSVHSSYNIVKEVDSNGPGKSLCKIGSPNHVSSDSIHSKVESGTETHSGDGEIQTGNLHKSNVKGPVDEFVNTNKLINSYGSVQLPPLYRDCISGAFTQKQRKSVKIGIRDDDENLFGCNKLSTKIWPFKAQPRIGHRRIRNMLTSKYRKVAPKLKGYELYNTREKMRSFYRYRKRIYTGERFQQGCNKKRKLSEHNFAVAHNREISCDSFSNLPEKGPGSDKCGSPSVFEKGHQKARDNHVKFSINSFKVPELYVEVPENASVGSLKRTVMEAVAAILGSGIRVGVVVQGKKVRDDNRTLKQAGISQSSNLDALGFTLEPKFTQFSPSTTPKKLPPSFPSDTDQELPRTPAAPLKNSGISNALTDPCLVKRFDGSLENNGFMSSPQTPENELPYALASESKAIVPVPPTSADTLAAVPLNSKPKRSELSQRRTRRPFSVSEVEALVGAVEKLGTGRWRDVKIGAFENADHRTYVDLKDKWKTLVHTASISPQQRRGEPVPQELLNRVLSAHSYWSQHQAKQQNGEGNVNVRCNVEGVGVKTPGAEDEA